MKKIALCDLSRQRLVIEKELTRRIQEVFSHSRFVGGPEIQELESRLSRFVRSKYAVAVSSGTDALFLSLLAAGIKPKDLVIVPVFTFIATAEVVSLLGAKPVFVDIDLGDYNLDISQVEKILTQPYSKKVKALIAVDLFGQCANYDLLRKTAKKHKLLLIEAAAQSIGAEYKARKAGSLADFGCVSFFPSKPLGCYGDGGMVFTQSRRYADKLRILREHGQRKKYEHITTGTNSRLDTLQAGVLLAKLTCFKKELQLRQKAADFYLRLLKPLEDKGLIALPRVQPYNKSAWAQFSIRVLKGRRGILQKSLAAKGIPTAVHYPKPLHLQPAFKYLGYKKGDFPVAEKVSKEILSLPFYPYLKKEEIEYICDRVEKALLA